MKRSTLNLTLTVALTCLSGLTSAEEPQSLEEGCPTDQAVDRPDDSRTTPATRGLDGVACVDEADSSFGGREEHARPRGDQSHDGAAESSEEEDPVHSPPERQLAVHGYLTQAYAKGTGRRLFGVTERGTADYRTAAIQFRYARGDKHSFVVQLSHERLGESPIGRESGDLELDWAFYQLRFTDTTSFRLGRVPIPHGIYSEIRDVGTLLPFYRPPPGLYFEGGFAAESLNGVVVTQGLAIDSDWPIELDVFVGEWSSLEYDFTVDLVNRAQIDNGFGAQIWLETPLPTLRLGVGAMHYDMNHSFIIQGGATDWLLSLDGEFGRFTTRAEYRNAGLPTGDYEAFYAQLGVRLLSKLSFFSEFSSADIVIEVEGYPYYGGNYNDDFAIALNYRLLEQIVVKAENHWFRGWAPGADGDLFLDPFPEKGEQLFLLSISLSF